MFQERIWFPNISYQQYTNHIKIVTNPSQCKRCVRSLFLLIIFNYNYQDFGVQSELLRQNYRNEKKKKSFKVNYNFLSSLVKRHLFSFLNKNSFTPSQSDNLLADLVHTWDLPDRLLTDQIPPAVTMPSLLLVLGLTVCRPVLSVEFLLCHVCGCPTTMADSDLSYDKCSGTCQGEHRQTDRLTDRLTD